MRQAWTATTEAYEAISRARRVALEVLSDLALAGDCPETATLRGAIERIREAMAALGPAERALFVASATAGREKERETV